MMNVNDKWVVEEDDEKDIVSLGAFFVEWVLEDDWGIQQRYILIALFPVSFLAKDNECDIFDRQQILEIRP